MTNQASNSNKITPAPYTISSSSNSWSIGSGITTGISSTAGNMWVTSSGTTFNNKHEADYVVFELPREEMPINVFVCGRMVTLGVLGTNVECAYVPSSKEDEDSQLVFSPGVINCVSYNARLTVSLDYKDSVYHYNIGKDGEVEYEEEDSLVVEKTLVSMVQK